MSIRKLIYTHHKQTAELNRQQKSDWKELIEKQEKEIEAGGDLKGLAGKHARERSAHNEKFDKAKSDLVRQQQKEYEEVQQQQKESGKQEEKTYQI